MMAMTSSSTSLTMNPESSSTKRQKRRKRKRHQQHWLPSFSSYLKKRDYEDQLGHQLAKIQSRLFTLTTTTNNENDFFDQALEEAAEATTQARRLIAKAHLEDF